eukprot:scaffold135886_cov33-Tisochrysis_lutea.AAC.6
MAGGGAEEPKDPPPNIRISKGGEYFLLRKGVWHEVDLSYLGTPMQSVNGKRIQGPPADLDKYPPTTPAKC